MQHNKLKYLVAGFIGVGAFLLASAGASAHLGSTRTVSEKSPTPAASGAASVSAIEEVEASPSPEPSETPEAAKSPEPAETPEVESTAGTAAGSNVEQEGDHEGNSGGGDSGD